MLHSTLCMWYACLVQSDISTTSTACRYVLCTVTTAICTVTACTQCCAASVIRAYNMIATLVQLLHCCSTSRQNNICIGLCAADHVLRQVQCTLDTQDTQPCAFDASKLVCLCACCIPYVAEHQNPMFSYAVYHM
jgi:hypothetical protein